MQMLVCPKSTCTIQTSLDNADASMLSNKVDHNHCLIQQLDIIASGQPSSVQQRRVLEYGFVTLNSMSTRGHTKLWNMAL